MFKSTYGYNCFEKVGIPVIPKLIFKAVDHERKIELLRIGIESTPDEQSYSGIYAISCDGSFIPFGVGTLKVNDYIPVSSLLVKPSSWQLHEKARVPVVEVPVFNIGFNLKEYKSIRGRLHYLNLWGNSDFHGHNFSTVDEKNRIFSYIQESLPVLLFDDYNSLCASRPVICKRVYLLGGKVANFDSILGNDDLSAHILSPQSENRESIDECVSRFENLSKSEPMTIEQIMSEILELERKIDYYGSHMVSTITGHPTFWVIMNRSYLSHYREMLESAEQLYYLIIDMIHSRIHSRTVYRHFAYA